tara:strand:+ start:1051 stop:1221 length:171 start_codon:yes stop_codon:yes gene_type:complete
MVGGGIAVKKFNLGAWTAVGPEAIVYIKDSRTGICFAQGSNLLATVPCDKVDHLLE